MKGDARGELLAERDALREELATITATPLDPMGGVSFGKRVGEGTSQAVERITQVSAADHLAAKLRETERALAKMDEGTYGICDGCGLVIAPERLAAVPRATRCMRCASHS